MLTLVLVLGFILVGVLGAVLIRKAPGVGPEVRWFLLALWCLIVLAVGLWKLGWLR